MASTISDFRSHAGLLMGLGIALIVLGSVAIYYGVYSTLATVAIFGWILIFAGFIQFGHALYARAWSAFFLQLVAGLLSLIAGILTIAKPMMAASVLTLLLAFLFIASGTTRIILAAVKHMPNWFWVLLSGFLTLILGIMILAEWPYSGLYIIGLFMGIDLIFNGWSLIMLSSMARKYIKG